MTAKLKITRRQLLVTGAAAGGALIIGFNLPFGERGGPAIEAQGAPINAFLRIAADNKVTIIVPQSEMGQGVLTSYPMLVAEELGCDWSLVGVEKAPGHPDYASGPLLLLFAGADYGFEVPEIMDGPVGWLAAVGARLMDVQVTGGSTSIRAGWTTMRLAGAAARDMLIAAAARQWGVEPGKCIAADSRVRHGPSGRTATFGALAAAAAILDPPANPRLKPVGEFKLLGQPLARLDIPPKTRGEAVFGIDVRLPNMHYAAVRAAPAFGGSVKSHDAAAITGRPGVAAVVELAGAVAVVADSWWRAKTALEALPVTFDGGPHAGLSSTDIFAAFAHDLDGGDLDSELERGDAADALGSAATVLKAEYKVPYLAHATMEPMNTTAWVHDGHCDIWSPTQAPLFVRSAAAKILDIDKQAVTVHVTYLGGGFGRRAMIDYAEQAVTIARQVPYPVQLIWTREEDIRHDFYRPAVLSRLAAGLGPDGRPTAWRHRYVGSAGGVDLMPYGIANVAVSSIETSSPIPTGFWRSVDHSQHAFFIESFIDEVAHAGGHDPVELRLSLLQDKPRHARVLRTAAEAAGWGKPLAEGHGRGVALHRSFGSIVAQVVEVAVGADGTLRVERVVCAVDCGIAINPDTIVAQIESGIIFGLTAALFGEITIRDGAVVEGNFPDYDMVRLATAPVIETHVIEGADSPGGIGEVATPPIAPAVANAVFDATGIRVRYLPLAKHDLRRPG